MGMILITPPAVLPVSASEARDHIRAGDEADDLTLDRLIRTATAALEGPHGLLSRALVPQVWRLDLDAFPDVISVPLPPCQAVTSVTYLDGTGAQQTLAPSAYVVRGLGDPDGATIHRAAGATWPTTWSYPGAVSISFTAGYSLIPEPIRQAILAHVATLYSQREAGIITTGRVQDFGAAASDLVEPFRIRGFGA
jgi:uncharacterized phiE125 gp8 family phage protein